MKRIQKRCASIIIIFLLFYIASCNSKQVPATITPTTTFTIQPTITPTATATTIPTLTPEASVCSQIDKQYSPFTMPESLQKLSDIDGTNWDESYEFLRAFELSIVHFLSFHGTSQQLLHEIQSQQGITQFEAKETDLDKDGENEVVVAVEFYKKNAFRGFLTFIAKCQRDQYIYYEWGVGSVFYSEPKIFLIDDINNDGLQDVVVTGTWHGSDSQPFLSIINWSNENNSFINIFKKDKIPLGNVEIKIFDTNNDGLDEITFHGRLDHRGDMNTMVTYTYAWNGQYYEQVKEEVTP